MMRLASFFPPLATGRQTRDGVRLPPAFRSCVPAAGNWLPDLRQLLPRGAGNSRWSGGPLDSGGFSLRGFCISFVQASGPP